MNDKAAFSVTREWVKAGKAIFTCHNPEGTSYTFQVKRVDDKDGRRPPVWFGSLLTGPDNEDDGSYTYLGIVHPETGALRLTKASRMDDEALSVRILRWALKTIWAGSRTSSRRDTGSTARAGAGAAAYCSRGRKESRRTGIGLGTDRNASRRSWREGK